VPYTFVLLKKNLSVESIDKKVPNASGYTRSQGKETAYYTPLKQKPSKKCKLSLSADKNKGLIALKKVVCYQKMLIHLPDITWVRLQDEKWGCRIRCCL
jgi:hypothetical protein